MTEDFDIMASRAKEPLFYDAPAPPGLTPKQFQLAGVEYHLQRDNAIFGDAPGLGKTIEAILLDNAIGSGSTLVTCPASLRLNWEREIWKWSTVPDVSTYPIIKAKDGVSFIANFVILSYDLVRNPGIFNALTSKLWDHLVLDEAHYLKSPKGNKRTQYICAPDGLQSKCGRITPLSGTLLPNQPIECYNIVRLVNWDAIDRMSLEDFREFYYEKGSGMIRGPVFDEETQSWSTKLHWSDEVRNIPRNLEDLQYRLRKHVMVRRLKEDVVKELPPKQWHPFPIVQTSAIKKALSHPGWGKAEKLYDMDPGHFNSNASIDGAISTARRLLGEAKAKPVADYVDDLLTSGVEKIIVCAWHHSVLDILRERLSKFGLVYMDGSTSQTKRQEAVDDFQNHDKVRIILGQMGPLSMGWTLTKAQDVVIVEIDWVPGNNDQLLDRVHRIGQEGGYVIGHVPVVPDSMDERILGTVIKKDQSIYKALDAPFSAW